MKKLLSKRAAIFYLAFLSVYNVNRVMAVDKVVVVPLGSSKPIYTLGAGNLFVGEGAGNHTMSGTENTGTGYYTLSANTTGVANTANGFEALFSNTFGNDNTAIGDNSLKSNTYGMENTAIGAASLMYNTTGGGNTASGYLALLYNTTGHTNTAGGDRALYHNSTGYSNTAIGYKALLNNSSGWQNTAIGESAGESSAGNYNTFVGYNAHAGSSDLFNVTAIGIDATPTASDSVRLGNDFVTWIGGHAAWSNTSDKRVKKDIQDVTQGLAFINALRPVEFKLKQGNDRVDLGFLAQDIEALLGTKYNILGIGGDKDRTLSLRYTDFIAPMVKAIQEQQNQIKEQQNQINEQLTTNAQQKEIITAMRAELDELKAEIKTITTGK